MRILKFIVSGQRIRPDPACDFSGIVPGSKGYLKAVFTFDSEWDGCEKIAEFRRYNVDKCTPVRLIGNSCIIPEEELVNRCFYVDIIGIRPGFRIKTGKLEVRQDG